MKWVQKLMDRGETVRQPEHGEPLGSIQGYIKTQKQHKDAGAIFQDFKDGTFGLFGDMGALHVTGLDWSDLGLCDSRCWYEWVSPGTYQPKKEETAQKEATTTRLLNQIQKSFELTDEIGKRAKALEDIYNEWLAKLNARSVYLEEDVVAGLHNEGLESGDWELFVNRVLREALQTLADKQER